MSDDQNKESWLNRHRWALQWGAAITATCFSLTVGVLRFYGDSIYFPRSEVKQYMEEFHKLRADDMAQIYARIEAVRQEAQTSDDIVRKLEGQIERIAAQNEIILSRLDRIQNGE